MWHLLIIEVGSVTLIRIEDPPYIGCTVTKGVSTNCHLPGRSVGCVVLSENVVSESCINMDYLNGLLKHIPCC